MTRLTITEIRANGFEEPITLKDVAPNDIGSYPLFNEEGERIGKSLALQKPSMPRVEGGLRIGCCINLFKVRHSKIMDVQYGGTFKVDGLMEAIKDHAFLYNIKLEDITLHQYLTKVEPMTLSTYAATKLGRLSAIDVLEYLKWVNPDLVKPFEFTYQDLILSDIKLLGESGLPIGLMHWINRSDNKDHRRYQFFNRIRMTALDPLIFKKILNNIDTTLPVWLNTKNQEELDLLATYTRKVESTTWVNQLFLAELIKDNQGKLDVGKLKV